MMSENKNVPRHVAIIPDGNRRWAKNHKLEAWLGHKKGSENLRSLLDVAVGLGISYVSFWGSSKDNLAKRPALEVNYLLKLFEKKFLDLAEDEKIHKNQIKINIYGSWREQFPESTKKSLNKAIDATKSYNRYFLNFFLAYSGTGEILDAIKCITKKSKDDESLEIDSGLLKSCLQTRKLPIVDLMIRTGGEPHLSDGFMMWDTANAQLYFSDKLWPDFNDQDFKKAIEDYSDRERRFGK